MSDDHTEILLMKAELQTLKSELDDMKVWKKESELRDRARIRAAFLGLGGAVLSLATYIWTMQVGAAAPK